MSDQKGGPAFPTNTAQEIRGMTLRDYFAAKAMSSVIGDFLVSGEITGEDVAEVLAKECYVIADAMLKARAK